MQSTLEILGDPEAFTRQMIRSAALNLWSAMPGIIESYSPEQQTVSVQPTIMGLLARPEGGADLVPLPILPDVPVMFFGGGGMTITAPIKPGDECLVIFADRCIDGWWWLGGVQPPSEARNHDLSDGFALVGLRSRPRWLQNISTESLQIRSVFPAPAGMNRAVLAARKKPVCVPRASGDEPLPSRSQAEVRMCSPRQRG